MPVSYPPAWRTRPCSCMAWPTQPKTTFASIKKITQLFIFSNQIKIMPNSILARVSLSNMKFGEIKNFDKISNYDKTITKIRNIGCYFISMEPLSLVTYTVRLGARYLVGDNLKVDWAQVSILSLAVLLQLHNKCMAHIQPRLDLKTQPRFIPAREY